MADGFKDRESFLDGLFDHIFGDDGDVSDEDQDWFEKSVASFFPEDKSDNDSGDKGGSSGGANQPRRRRPSDGGTGPRRRRRASAGSGESRYGSRAFWGN